MIFRKLPFQFLTPVGAACASICLSLQAPAAPPTGESRPGAAGSADEGVPVRIEVLAPAQCPNADEFLARLDEHLPARSAGADEPAHALTVTIALADGGVLARLDSPSTAGVSGHDIQAEDCDAAFSALAFSAALALEGKPPPRKPSVSPKEGERESGPALRPGPKPDAPQPEAPLIAAPSPKPMRTSPRPTRWSVGIGARSWALSLPVLLGPELLLSAGRGSWQLRSSIRYLGEVANSSPELALRAASWGVQWCALPWRGRSGQLGLCASTDLAVVWGRGQGVEEPRTAGLGYGASGARVRGRLQLGRRWFLEGDVGADGVWWTPTWVATDPARTLEAARRLNLSTGLGMGLSF